MIRQVCTLSRLHELYIAAGIPQGLGGQKERVVVAICRMSAAVLVVYAVVWMTGSAPALAGAPDEIEIPLRKPDAPKPVPDVWSAEEIGAARLKCAALLSKITAEYETLDPIKKGVCGDPAPLKVSALGKDENRVEIVPPAIMNCAMAAKLAKWLTTKVQPSAKMILKSKIVRIRNIASYACRRRYGNPNKRMSEHAYANALDIAGFETASNKTLTLLNDWGVTKRDMKKRETEKREAIAQEKAAEMRLIAAAKRAQQAAAKQKVAQNTPAAKKQDLLGISAAQAAEDGDKDIEAKARAFAAKAPIEVRSKEEIAKQKDPSLIFLHKVFTSACDIFGTVLTPEANYAHRNHFHVDLAYRRRRAYCE